MSSVRTVPLPSAAIQSRYVQQNVGEVVHSTRQGGADVSVTTRGTRRTVHRRFFIGDEYPWDKVLFGYTISGADITVMAGEIHFKKSIYTCAETDPALTVAADETYIYVEMEWGTGICAVKQTTVKSDATTSDSHFRKWLYLLDYDSDADSISVKTYGHTGGAIVIMPVLG